MGRATRHREHVTSERSESQARRCRLPCRSRSHRATEPMWLGSGATALVTAGGHLPACLADLASRLEPSRSRHGARLVGQPLPPRITHDAAKVALTLLN